jgi:PAS domain S-box-containing protein
MRSFRHLPIKVKLRLVILLTSATALLLACVASVGYEFLRYRGAMFRDLTTQAEIISVNCAPALASGDPRTARETLAVLGNRRGILAARMYRSDGTLVAEYVRAGANVPPLPASLRKDGYWIESGRARLCRRIHFGNEDVGAVVLSADTRAQRASFLAFAGIAVVVMLVLLLISLVLSTPLQHFISGPILSLAEVAREVSLKKDYSLRAPKQTDDEIGALADGFNQMLSEFERNDAQLRSSEEWFRQLAENIREAFWMTDPAKGEMIYISPGYEAIWGRTCASLYKTPLDWLAAIHPEDLPGVRETMAKQAVDKYDQTYRIFRPDGTMRWIHDRAFPIQNEKGEVYRIAGIAEDITERKRTEAALDEKAGHLRAVVARAPIIVFTVNKDGIITTEEGGALHDAHAVPGRNIGRHMAQVFSEYPRIIENLNRCLFGEEFIETVEFGGQVFTTWYAPQLDERSNIIGVVGVATNVTERHRLERQVLEISDREQARIGQDLHDGLCQHLVGLAFAANTLEQNLAAKGLREATAAREIAAMLDDAISQARDTAHGLYPARLEAEGLASALGELTVDVTRQHGVECRLEYPEPVLLSDNTATIQLYRIAQEAVRNAVRHANARQIILRLTREDGRVNLSVRDDGVGISKHSRNNPGMGLNIMEYRARTIGGSLAINPHGSGGTEVVCQIAAAAPPASADGKKEAT